MPGPGSERYFDTEAPTFVYEVAHKYEKTFYFCHDQFGSAITPAVLLHNLKTYLACGVPAVFGFYVFPSYKATNVIGAFPYPSDGERAFAGHAVAAVGYDDNLKIKNTLSNKEATGAPPREWVTAMACVSGEKSPKIVNAVRYRDLSREYGRKV
jgi:C1A family cysteine protease